MIRLAIATLLILLYPVNAFGQEDSRWVRKLIGHKHVCEWTGQCWYEPVYRRVYHAYAHPHPQPRGYHQYSYRNENRRCEQVVDVLSTEHTEENNARNAAVKLWMAKAQWLYGGMMMDLENAQEVLWRCSASNAHDTISGRLAEGVAKLTGKEGQNVRCQLWARTCTGQREPDRRR